jgi:hypothetical protein
LNSLLAVGSSHCVFYGSVCLFVSTGSYRFSRDRPRFADNLDVIKFLCKDLWTILFKKQVDNLKTNHRVSQFGTYIERAGHYCTCIGSFEALM